MLPMITRFRVLEVLANGGSALVEWRLETGRTHQVAGLELNWVFWFSVLASELVLTCSFEILNPAELNHLVINVMKDFFSLLILIK
jgi:hypothetical protein